MRTGNKRFVKALVANQQGELFELDGYAAVGMAGQKLVPLIEAETINMPVGSEHLYLPDRRPILYNRVMEEFEVLTENPYAPGEPVFPVAAFNAPGYVVTLISAYAEEQGASPLPLFSYGAVGWLKGGFRVAALRVDRERRQDLRLMPQDKIVAGIARLRRIMPSNRLRAHLEVCALTYGCPAAKNLFLGRYEAPLPTSTHCNARCLGCLSLQKDSGIVSTQERIDFTPTPEEIAEIATYHIKHTKRPVVSFGQGCEGEPLLAAHVIEPAIRLIRKTTARGTINMNTNASLPSVLERLFEAGLDSIRVSMNSVRKPYYEAYFRPRGYRFKQVIESLDLARRKHKFASINYLNLPGFTDAKPEVEALLSFLARHPVQMIQWRNLNFDPVRYWQIMGKNRQEPELMGMRTLIKRVRHAFPGLKFGYFNPPKETFQT
ncbi:MAG: radical SAM protein [Deltaproteobacteria bacterium]|nr:radical SAM protein [Deltaproteobacteria bacterium]MBW2074718.1 radical SAM protein [Deltaproteobacteria bacterium]RLB80844.1 MAG: radical SAM protein [Deltaproteobacteria bacterium]